MKTSVLLSILFTPPFYNFSKFLIHQSFEARVCLYLKLKIELLWQVNSSKAQKRVVEPFVKNTIQGPRIIQTN